MCSGPRKLSPSPSIEASLLLLELAASDDVASFKDHVSNHSIDASAGWYGRSAGHMGVHDRTPLMIAALYGSAAVVEFILSHPAAIDINRCSASDGATALHLAASGGASSSLAVTRMLIDASADVDIRDAYGQRPGDVIARQFSSPTGRVLETLFKAPPSPPPARVSSPETPKSEKKEYPTDVTLPDINTGIYGTDEFRMYAFKVKPCSRAYSHDWTECPFVHPGENARRRDPRKYVYTCVPCPEFRKGSCRHGDNCEYAHGVFECWLHPAQYRTRLCKDEVGCNRRVCFFAHRRDELRSVNPTADMATALLMSSPKSPMGYQPPNLQLPASRLKSSLSARNRYDLDLELLGLEGYQQKLLSEIANSGSPRSMWQSGMNSPAAAASMGSDYSSLFGSQLASGMNSPAATASMGSDYSNLFGSQLATNQLLSGCTNSQLPSSPSSMAKAIMNSRSAAFANRSQSFCDRSSALPRHPPSLSSEWGSHDGKLDWGVQGDELSKFRKSLSFGFRGNQRSGFGVGPTSPPKPAVVREEEPDLSWVQSLVKEEQMYYAESEMVV